MLIYTLVLSPSISVSSTLACSTWALLCRPSTAAVANLVRRNSGNITATNEGIRDQNLHRIFQAFMDRPLCGNLSLDQARDLFRQNIRSCLEPWFDRNALS